MNCGYYTILLSKQPYVTYGQIILRVINTLKQLNLFHATTTTPDQLNNKLSFQLLNHSFYLKNRGML
ncbi:hypothetical protein Cantr_03357 [Candida viswanathii]|uniref:Uncharacterized protein n=1 Tax=Candida viswanathii TaxID=5486 RepID=A0A367YLJ4_9ASCO|nr:hypothetical protein Cantr_03357 [Candida viswanathii]